jgi:RNA polymerase sigma-70 factor (family 1)
MEKGVVQHLDATLVEKLSRGDREAFQTLYQLYWKECYVHALRVVRSQEVAKDIVQDLFVTLWNKRTALFHIQSIRKYLRTSVKNACIRYIERHIDRYEDIELLFEKVIAESEILPTLYLKELQAGIDHCVAAMPPKMRQVFEMSRESEKTHAEIAEALGISKETVKKHIQHALRLLKQHLGTMDQTTKAILVYWIVNNY